MNLLQQQLGTLDNSANSVMEEPELLSYPVIVEAVLSGVPKDLEAERGTQLGRLSLVKTKELLRMHTRMRFGVPGRKVARANLADFST